MRSSVFYLTTAVAVASFAVTQAVPKTEPACPWVRHDEPMPLDLELTYELPRELLSDFIGTTDKNEILRRRFLSPSTSSRNGARRIAAVRGENARLRKRLSGPDLSRDGVTVRAFEKTPIIGYLSAAVFALRQDKDRQKRAVAYCTAATCTFTLRLGAGLLVAGATAGTAAVAAPVAIPIMALTGAVGGVCKSFIEGTIAKGVVNATVRDQLSDTGYKTIIRDAVSGTIIGVVPFQYLGTALAGNFGSAAGDLIGGSGIGSAASNFWGIPDIIAATTRTFNYYVQNIGENVLGGKIFEATHQLAVFIGQTLGVNIAIAVKTADKLNARIDKIIGNRQPIQSMEYLPYDKDAEPRPAFRNAPCLTNGTPNIWASWPGTLKQCGQALDDYVFFLAHGEYPPIKKKFYKNLIGR